MSFSTTTSRQCFQFRLSDIFWLMLAVALGLTAVRYQSTLVASGLLAGFAAWAVRVRSPLRTSVAFVFGSAAVVLLGITLGWCVLLAAPHETSVSVPSALLCLSVVMILGGSTLCVCSAGVLVFTVLVATTKGVEGLREEFGDSLKPAAIPPGVAENAENSRR